MDVGELGGKFFERFYFKQAGGGEAVALVLAAAGPFGGEVEGILGVFVKVRAVVEGTAGGVGEEVAELAGHLAAECDGGAGVAGSGILLESEEGGEAAVGIADAGEVEAADAAEVDREGGVGIELALEAGGELGAVGGGQVGGGAIDCAEAELEGGVFELFPGLAAVLLDGFVEEGEGVAVEEEAEAEAEDGFAGGAGAVGKAEAGGEVGAGGAEGGGQDLVIVAEAGLESEAVAGLPAVVEPEAEWGGLD